MHCCMWACCWVERLLSLDDAVSEEPGRRATAGEDEERMRRDVDAEDRIVEHWIRRALRKEAAANV